VTPPLRRGPREGLLVVVLAVVAVVALAQSWNGWLDPIIDTGRDLYVSEQLAHGAKLYRDLRYQYPPLAPYLLAAVAGPLAAFTAVGPELDGFYLPARAALADVLSRAGRHAEAERALGVRRGRRSPPEREP